MAYTVHTVLITKSTHYFPYGELTAVTMYIKYYRSLDKRFLHLSVLATRINIPTEYYLPASFVDRFTISKI